MQCCSMINLDKIVMGPNVWCVLEPIVATSRHWFAFLSCVAAILNALRTRGVPRSWLSAIARRQRWHPGSGTEQFRALIYRRWKSKMGERLGEVHALVSAASWEGRGKSMSRCKCNA
ncbi:hypothetical protein BRADI_4g36981v3 [Brachypodium distachyon]|uniref:Uncharacterized protein n=2 Tax=Brachypodium distachyon TaxID=15368 RepID=A0A2K2CST5_BRADI|nr:hypothetical protein BRADI_4g36981v3 [Brachypodium distachyon]